jgi:hypothetical protein
MAFGVNSLENRVIQFVFHQMEIGRFENINTRDHQGDDDAGNQAGPVFIIIP